MKDLKEIVEPLIRWFRENKRDLPWRQTKDPYAVWVSEIMLQQTRVEAVKPYYIRFLQTLPTVKDLANADEEAILKLWEGLGYYSRVRNMQKAAIQIMEDFGGVFPANQKDLLSLKGIGSYTAGAVGSFGLPIPAVDGNVLRVMSRITADASDISLQITKKEWESRLAEIMPQECAGDLNQALMELGAMVCLPNGAPKCGVCPVRASCMAYCKNQTAVYPVKAEKKPRTLEYLNVFFCVDGEKIAIGKRPKNGLLSGLWELPNGQRDIAPPVTLQEMGILEAELLPMKGQKHIFTHVEWQMQGFFIRCAAEAPGLEWADADALGKQIALPSAFKIFLPDALTEKPSKAAKTGEKLP